MTSRESAETARERILQALRAEDQEELAARLEERLQIMKQARA